MNAFEDSLPPPQSLEQVRSKLQQLTTTLQSLHQKLLLTQPQPHLPLPPWSSVQSSLSVIFSQLASLSDSLQRHAEEILWTTVYPNKSFPVVTNEGLLTTLFRTKPLPESDKWNQQAQHDGVELSETEDLTFTESPAMDNHAAMIEDDEERDIEVLRASEWVTVQRSRRQWTGFYTAQEVEDAFEIDKDDLEDIRRRRQEEAEKGLVAMKAMLRFSRSGR